MPEFDLQQVVLAMFFVDESPHDARGGGGALRRTFECLRPNEQGQTIPLSL